MIRYITNLYPKKNNPQSGIFIKEQLDALVGSVDFDVHILKSIFPAFTENWKVYAADVLAEKNLPYDLEELDVLDFPKQVGLKITLNLLNKNLQKMDWKKVDLVHIHYLYPGILVTPFLIENKIPYIIHIHGSDWEQFRSINRLKNIILDGLIQAKKIVFPGDENYKNAQKLYPNKCFYLPNGIDFNSIELKNTKNKLLDEKTLLCVANVTKGKGLKRLLAFMNTPKKHKWKIEVYGKVIDKGIMNELKQGFESSKHSIDFHGAQPKSEIYKALKNADVFVHTSLKESFGIAVIEAMYAKLPIIASNTGIIQQATSNSALLKTDFNKPDELTWFLDNHEEINSKDIELNHTFASKFSLGVYKERLLNLYEEIRIHA